MSEERGEITRLLESWTAGDATAAERLMPLVYDELRQMAGRFMDRERGDHTLQATALVHEAYLRLVDQRAVSWQERSQFFAMAATMMRRILVDHARGRSYAKRGGGSARLSIDDAGEPGQMRQLDLVALDDALEDLARLDRDRASMVELRYFGGLSLQETADVLGCSRATVIRQWRVARAWLYQQLAASA
ncbi:MAG: sigma-70 family RNA polymerase sigma factor [Holophagales bacterium]|nr:sigma-70 family RNA polymerase sigma factor [Holophagales bacterium]